MLEKIVLDYQDKLAETREKLDSGTLSPRMEALYTKWEREARQEISRIQNAIRIYQEGNPHVSR